MQEIIQSFDVNLGTSTQTIGELRQNFDDTTASIQKAIEFIDPLNENLNLSTGYLKQMRQQAEETTAALENGMAGAAEATKVNTAANEDLANSYNKINQSSGIQLDSLAKQKIAFIDLGRVVTDQGFSLRSVAANFSLLGPAITIAIAAIAGIAYAFDKYANSIVTVQDANDKLTADIVKSTNEQIGQVTILTATIQDQNTSQKERTAAIQTLIDQHPNYFANLKDEDGITKNLATDTAKFTQAIQDEARAKAAGNEISKLYGEIIKEQSDALDNQTYLTKRLTIARQDGDGQAIDNIKAEMSAEQAASNTKVADIQKQIDVYTKLGVAASQALSSEGGGTGKSGKTQTDTSAIKAREKALADEQKFHDDLLKINDNAEAKEELALTQKYIRDKDELENSNLSTTQLTIDYQNGIQDIKNKYLEKSLDADDKAFNEALLHKQTRDQKQHDKDIEQVYKDAQDLADAQAAALKLTDNNKIADDKAQLKSDDLTYSGKKALLDKFTADNKKAFDNQSITYRQFVNNKAEIAKSEEKIDKERLANQVEVGAAVGNLLTTLSQAVGQNTQAGKDIAIAGSIVSTIAGAIGAFTKTSGAFPAPYGEILGVIAGASVLAAGYAQIATLEKVAIPGQGSSSAPSAPTITYTAPNIPTATNNTNLSAQSLQQINQANSSPIRAYVVEADISSSQQTINNYRSASRVGGH